MTGSTSPSRGSAIQAPDPSLLSFLRPYGFDPQQLAVTVELGLTSVEELAGQSICTTDGDTGLAWLEGTLALVDPTLPPAEPPKDAAALPVATDEDCVAQAAAGGAPFAGWLASLPTIDGAIGDGTRVTTVGDPVVWAPVGVAFDAKAADDDASLIQAVDTALTSLTDDGTLAKQSIRFLGYDLTVVPEDGVPVPAASAAP
ncbi:MAG: transporter substrate-binding domain-containing protein [Tetrasphaera sp.]